MTGSFRLGLTPEAVRQSNGVGVIAPKERSDRLLPRTGLTNESRLPGPEGREPMDMRAVMFTLRARIRPCSLGLIALAVAVFLWGFGYKLSLYHVHPNPFSHISQAKLWIEPRNARTVAGVMQKAKAEPAPCADSLAVTTPAAGLCDAGRAEIAAPGAPSQPVSGSPLPSRSPPAARFFLA